jgi:HlyD family secretion protein
LAFLVLPLVVFPLQAQKANVPANAIGGTGQIVPDNGVAALIAVPGARVTAVYVSAGQAVKAGTLLMRTENLTPTGDVQLAKMQLDQAGALQSQEVAAQEAAVRLAQSVSDEAKHALEVYRGLGPNISSKKQLEKLTSAARQAALALEAETAKLTLVKTQTASAWRTAKRQYELAAQSAELRAPIDGTVLKVNGAVGSPLGSDPAVEMADLHRMAVVAQVYVADLLDIKIGMRATITGGALRQPLQGHVVEVGREVNSKSGLGEIRILLDQAEPADRLVGMEVDVMIHR